MGKATVEQFSSYGIELGEGTGIFPPASTLSNVTTSATAANTSLGDATRVVRVFAEDTAERVAIGNAVTATATSVLVPAGTEFVRAVPRASGWRVSIINA